MIELKNVNKSYGKEQKVIDDVSIQIQEGDMISIMGPSGAGKSTLLKIIGLLDNEYEGGFVFNGTECMGLSDNQRAQMRNKHIGFVFQGFHLIRDMSAVENVKMAMVISNSNNKFRDRIPNKKMEKAARDILKSIGLEDHMDRAVSKLSGGQQQRVAIARALINDPQLILADEPTGSLDQKTGREIMDILKKLNEQGKTILIVTHDENVAAYCKSTIHIIDGKIKTADAQTS